MTDEEVFLFMLMVLCILEENRQQTVRRILAFAYWQVNLKCMQLQRAALQYFANAFEGRRAWVYHRQDNKFETYYAADLNTSKELDPNYWLHNYRMGRETFDYICMNVFRFMVKDDLNMRKTIPVHKRVAVAIWWLANGGSYRSTGQTFGISASIVGRITKDFVGALVYLRNRYIFWPKTRAQCSRVIESFKDLSPLPNVFGAIDGTHVEIIAPETSTVDFFNRKQRHSIGCQGICDGELRFISMSTGFPGSVHDSRILRNTWIHQAANNRNILTYPEFDISENFSIKPYLVGDAAYPLSEWQEFQLKEPSVY